MQFAITMGVQSPDFHAIDSALRAVDPAALAVLDGATLQVATYLGSAELAALITRAGFPLRAEQVTQLPSVCCGGCGG